MSAYLKPVYGPGESDENPPSETPTDYNYASHRWTSRRQYIPGEPDEWVTYCADCGVEDLGDPAEFPELAYPHCNDMGDEL